jgi:CubicO group peptidase (beta-lactamase class C family)
VKGQTCTKLMCLGVLATLVALLPVLSSPALGMPPPPNQVLLSAPHQQGPTDPEELETFLDAFFAEQMEALHIPGAVFILVKDGETFFSKGYGLADLESQRPVIPGETLFRVGSVSKLFTATAIMQLVEQERLDLDDDVNQYLKSFQLEENYPRPVTIANLLTHTGGFDERLTGTGVRSPSELVPLGPYLADNMPPRVMPPGDTISYSNHGYALAGYLVEEISGMPFEQYIEENVLQPLDMNHSSFRQPLRPELASDLAVGYVYTTDYQVMPVEYLNIAPAGSLYATATDMAHFMIAHLQNGRYEGTRILEAETAQEMHRRQFTHHPQLAGWAYGFYEHIENGQRALAHGGDITGFSSLLFLLPEQNLGFFVSFNASVSALFGLGDPREELVSRFLDRYYPVAEGPVSGQPSADLQRFSGNYRMNRYARTTLEKGLPPIPMLQWRVTANDDGTLTLEYPPMLGGNSSLWTEVEPLLFQNVDGDGYIAFREDENGRRITHMFIITFGTPMALEKVSWYETDAFQLILIGFFVLAFLSVLAWPVGSLIRHLRKRPAQPSRPALWARCLAGLVSALNLVFVVGLVVRLGQVFSGVFYGTPAYFVALLVIPLLTAILTVGLVVFTVLAWRDDYWSALGRLHYSLIAVAALVFIWFVNYWNLLGFRF